MTKLFDEGQDEHYRQLVLELGDYLRSDALPLALLLIEGQWRLIDFAPFLRDLLSVPEGTPLKPVNPKKLESLYRETKVTGNIVAFDRSLKELALSLYERVKETESRLATERERAFAAHEGIRAVLKRADAALAVKLCAG